MSVLFVRPTRPSANHDHFQLARLQERSCRLDPSSRPRFYDTLNLHQENPRTRTVVARNILDHMSRTHATSRMKALMVLIGLSSRQCYYRSILLDVRPTPSPHFRQAFRMRPNPLDARRYGLSTFYNAQPHRPWYSFERAPYECGPTDRGTSLGHSTLVCSHRVWR